MLFISGRDLVFAAHKKVLENGAINLVAVSVEDDRRPPVKKYVRGEVKVRGKANININLLS